MRIVLENICKSYHGTRLFQHVNLSLTQPNSTAILGPNGSGKSTFLQVIAGYVSPTSGNIRMESDDHVISSSQYATHISMAAPYLELPAELSLEEMTSFHFRFKPLRHNADLGHALESSGLASHKQKAIRHLSSGMKQRVKLILALLADTPVVLLDEPTSNLDRQGIQWYRDLVNMHIRDRLCLVASNHQENEYDFCDAVLDITDFK
ncbi:MAG: ABC transporter ATP-binding protein [Flavobacteriales bacterium]|nr:ABC transporter ATP-binding protein [Flavobacteriales bacterium]